MNQLKTLELVVDDDAERASLKWFVQQLHDDLHREEGDHDEQTQSEGGREAQDGQHNERMQGEQGNLVEERVDANVDDQVDDAEEADDDALMKETVSLKSSDATHQIYWCDSRHCFQVGSKKGKLKPQERPVSRKLKRPDQLADYRDALLTARGKAAKLMH